MSPFLYGTISCGADTWSGALGGGRQVFSVDSRLRSDNLSHRTNYHRTDWSKYPNLDLLIISNIIKSRKDRKWIEDWGRPERARNLLVFDGPGILTDQQGKGYKGWCKVMKGKGYNIHTWHVKATECGASIRSTYIVTFCHSAPATMILPLQLPISKVLRPCQNLIKTYGIPSSQYFSENLMKVCPNPPYDNCIGTLFGQQVYQWDGPFSCTSNHNWILVPGKGIRKVQMEEMAKMKGLNDSIYNNLSYQILSNSVEQHVFAAISVAIAPTIIGAMDNRPPLCSSTYEVNRRATITSKPIVPWTWNVPNLSINSCFYQKRIQGLKSAIRELNLNYTSTMKQGLDILEAHRTNYGMEGPKHLVILWWEWPKEHWNDLRLGVSMNFMAVPTPGISENQDMDGPTLEAAIKFVDELISLRVLCIPPPSTIILNTFPLFLVIKPHQIGQYRTIADGKQGGQNNSCVADPCHMTSPDHILPYLYKGGHSATLDLSKYFHMFLTLEEEHKYMGLTHPGTGQVYIYRTLPMGTRNSPGASGRFGAAFIRMVLDNTDLFGGTPRDNSLQQYFVEKVTHPTLGDGRVLIGTDGLPAVLIWLHVDDILIHASTREKLVSALNFIMELTVKLGLVCQPCKTAPPSQRVKYCGFEYDTSSTPTLHIPQSKVSRAIAVTTYLTSTETPTHSRLVVSMVTGYLQSLVPATPGNIGAAFLRPIYDDLHSLSIPGLTNTRQAYYQPMTLSTKSNHCLHWWIQALTSGLSHQSQPQDIATLGATWGDGSGTGAGGTFNLVSQQENSDITTLDVWQGIWTTSVAQFSSNWKELKTLHQTLLHEDNLGGNRIRGRKLLYFTDNMVTYDIFRKGTSKSIRLWTLLLHIKLLELKLNCIVQVIHVPGTTMIAQGSDGLSRGIHMQSLASHQSNSLIPLLWRAAAHSHTLL